MIVADTNLTVYLLLDTAPGRAADRFVSGTDWLVPPVWASGFRNVLVTHVRTGRLDAGRARRPCAAARALVLDVPVDPVAVLDVAFERGLSGYDAEFVALAEALGVPLVTDDRRVLAACPGVAVPVDAFAAG